MFSVNLLRGLRPCVVSQSFSYSHVTTTTPFLVQCFKPVNGKQLRSVRRSQLCLNNQFQSLCPSRRPLSVQTRSEDGNLIYKGNLGTAVRGVKMFSYTTSGISLFLMPQILLKMGVHNFAVQATFCGVVSFFTFLTPVILHVLTKGYVIRLYHNPDTDTYTAVTCNIFLMKKKTVFHQSQVRIPAVSKMFTTFYANNTGLLVNPDLFDVPQDYNHLMGYDRPFSFKLNDVDRPDKS